MLLVTGFFVEAGTLVLADGFFCVDRFEKKFVDGAFVTVFGLFTEFAAGAIDDFSVLAATGFFCNTVGFVEFDPGTGVTEADATRLDAWLFTASAPRDRFTPATVGPCPFCGDSDFTLDSSSLTSPAFAVLASSTLPLLFEVA